jgi:CHAT domain-containing protein
VQDRKLQLFSDGGSGKQVNQAPGHLTDAQIQAHVANSPTDPAAQKWLEAHLADCESCLDRLLDAERIHLGLLEGDGMKQAPHPGCPADKTLQELAAGICAADTAATTTEHAAHCSYCGPRLGRYLREFSDDPQSEDAALLGQLETSASRWQKKFVREHMAGGKEISKGWFSGWWPRLATATAGLAIAAGLFFYIRRPDDLGQAQKLVASAYGERRTTEMRLPAAPYGHYQPVPVVKGSSDGNDWESAPAPLVEAEGIIKNNKSADTSSQWLDVQGRINLLQGSAASVDRSIEAFQSALTKNPQNLELKVDLAAAYFEKEMLADRDRPVLVKTIDLLEDVVKNAKKEDQELKAAALFNLAIAYEKSEMLDVAASTWEQYLAIDNSSDWAAEARKHLQDLKGREPPRAEKGHETPAYFLSHADDPAILNDLEEYQETALRTWMPAAVEDRSSEAARAVGTLAELLRQHHSDPWLHDFASQVTAADLPAVKSLADALAYDLNDLHRQALVRSHSARVLFARNNVLAGELRAQYQEIYALQRTLASDDCLEAGEKLWIPLSRTEYHWLQAQLELEKATCANRTLGFDKAAANLAISRKIALQFRFPNLLLRVAGFDAGIQFWQKNYEEGWGRAVQGLALYWHGGCVFPTAAAMKDAHACPPSWERLYQFYSVMQLCARNMGLLHASEVLLAQSMAIFENGLPDDAGLRAILHLRLANTLLSQGRDVLAQAEADKAKSLLGQFSQDESATKIYASVTRIELADFELKRGHAAQAAAEIEPVEAVLPSLDDFVRFDFYAAQADTLRQLGRLDDAIAAYTSGIQVAEGAFGRGENEALRLNWVSATSRAYRGLTRALLAAGRDLGALSLWERFQRRAVNGTANDDSGRATQRTNFSWPIPSTAEPHLIYVSFEDGLQIWFVNGEDIRGKWVSLRQEDLLAAVHKLVKECTNPQQTTDEAEELYSLIVQPIVSFLPSSGTLAVELDSPLWGLPFAALRSPDGKYLAESYSLVYSPGLLSETLLRRPEPVNVRDPMLLVDGSGANMAAPLPGHAEEVEAVKRAFVDTRVLGPARITSDQVKGALGHSIGFHFSGHGSPDGTGTALVIGPGATLAARDFTPTYLKHLRLAVLSACASGSAAKGAFDQSNLVRSFLVGGVPSVVASGWDVDSRSTAEFMGIFYDRLRQGESTAKALQHAQTAMRSVNSHPYYWASFTLTGRAE